MTSLDLQPPGAERHFTDSLGRTWLVREHAAPWVRAPFAASHLRFECGLMVREVWTVPPDWRALSDQALLALTGA